ncbi:hypothetical protein [Sulfitobacter geojensis]|uniref:hypothetical protein n=1 Tax=Sulfitobacter geojensis TaxID=1342299 RepID=UPI002493A2AC|nr:hypothetical protein [Sulfitobacter geojensis]
MRLSMPNLSSTFYSSLVAAALILAVALSGFAHRGGQAALSPDLAAYVAAGGALADLCGGPGEQEGGPSQKCEACRQIGAAVIPHSVRCAPAILNGETRTLTFVAKRLHHARPLDPAQLTRAPPQA